MSIDLTEHEGLVYKMLHDRGFPQEEREEGFQDFAVYFYNNYKKKEGLKVSTAISTYFHSWLTQQAFNYKRQKRIPNKAYEYIDTHNPDWLDHNASGIRETPEELLLCEEIWSQISDDLKSYVLFIAQGERHVLREKYGSQLGNPVKFFAERDGVSRQAVEKRLKNELNRVKNRIGD